MPDPEVPKRSIISIEFAAIGLADPTISVTNCTPGQMAAAAWQLAQMANEQRLGAMQRQAMAGIVRAVPGGLPNIGGLRPDQANGRRR